MFVLDTNVLSEIMKSVPEASVADWVDRQPRADLFTTVMSKAEVLAGIAAMPTGRRRTSLEGLAQDLFGIGFRGRVLPFDDESSVLYAQISTARRRSGRTISVSDSIIASIARRHGATVVTRDVGGFELTGVPVLDPWNPPR